MYTYLDNWENEIQEDYFSTPWVEINWALEDEYDVIYLNSYTLERYNTKGYEAYGHIKARYSADIPNSMLFGLFVYV